jgi:phage/plasmid-like protein (TIGR03299 family)
MGYVDTGVHTAKNWIGGVNSTFFDEEGNGRKLYPQEALRLAGMDKPVTKEPLFHNGRHLQGKFVTVQDGNPLGVVGRVYEVVQDGEAFDILTGLVDSSDVEIECAFRTHGGRRSVVVARRPDHIKIAGEEITPFLTCMNTHDGSGQIELFTTPVRWGCDNVLRTAKSQAKTSYRIRHTPTARERVQQAREALELSFTFTDSLVLMGEELVNTKVTDREFDQFLKDLFPADEEDKGKRGHTRAINKQDSIRNLYMTAPNLQNVKGTKWGAWNAVVEWDQHVRRHKNPDVRFQNVMSVGGLPDRALEILTK